MSAEPRHEGDYTTRQVEAARRVLVDVGQVLVEGFRVLQFPACAAAFGRPEDID